MPELVKNCSSIGRRKCFLVSIDPTKVHGGLISVDTKNLGANVGPGTVIAVECNSDLPILDFLELHVGVSLPFGDGGFDLIPLDIVPLKVTLQE